MSTVSAHVLTTLVGGASPEPAPAGSARGAARAAALAPVSVDGGSRPDAVLPWLAADAAAGGATGWLVSALAGRPGDGAGYAQLTAKASSTGSKSSGTAAKAPASTAPRITGEWAFLTDPSLSIEDKLARFLVAVQKKMDDELTDKMEEYKTKYGEGGSETKKDEGGGIFGAILKVLVPPLAIADSIFGGVDEFLAQGLKLLGGPMLAALATALGMPALAPAALALGKGIGEAVVASRPKPAAPAKTTDPAKPADKAGTKTTSTGTKGTSTSAKDKTSSTTAKGEAGSPDERLEMLEIQRLVEKQNQMFTLVSNVMKSMHDTAMVAVQNVR